MRAKLLAAMAMLLGATSVGAQSTAPVTAPPANQAPVAGDAGSRTVIGRPMRGRNPSVAPQMPPRQRLQEMETTLKSMHALLKKMQATAASSKSKDSAAAANLQMWELMLAHLDKQFDQLRAATLEREDLEARRAALYNQAYSKAAKEAQDATRGATGQTPPAPSTATPSPKP